MKDLYTFDASEEEALETYEIVRNTYKAFFNELKIPYLVAEAQSGDIGGETSHEYHIPSAKGEDVILSCSKCTYLINEELERDKSFERDKLNVKATAYHSVARITSEGEPAESLGIAGVERTLKKDDGDCCEERLHVSLGFKIWHAVTADRSALVEAVVPQTMKVANRSGSISHWRDTEVCTNSIKRLYPTLDLSVQRPREVFEQSSDNSDNVRTDIDEHPRILRYVHKIFDYRLSRLALTRYDETAQGSDGSERCKSKLRDNVFISSSTEIASIVKIAASDPCPNCDEGEIKRTKAIELGHTFHLGTRYSGPLDACFTPSLEQSTAQVTTSTVDTSDIAKHPNFTGIDEPQSSRSIQASRKVPIQMGCHGIGISRMIAAVADTLADTTGLNWPRVMAPFEVVIISKEEHQDQVPIVYNALNTMTSKSTLAFNESMDMPLDIIVDDRTQGLVWKLKDADLIGYPVIVVLGKRYRKQGVCEVQCRRLGVKEDVHIDRLNRRVRGLLQQL